ncbi:MAG: DUF6684 family protein [Haloarculaceae archaeon]
MSPSVFDRDTMLDLTVNVIPLVIMAFFVAAFVFVNPFSDGNNLIRAIQFGIVVVTFGLLSILTYYAAKAIEGGESGDHAEPPVDEERAA